MKKGLAILLFFLYAIAASGVAISFHYCGGSLKYVGLTPDKDDKGCCGTKKKDKCCKDKVVKITKQDHRQGLTKYALHPPDFSKLITSTSYLIFNSPKEVYYDYYDYRLRPPPLLSGGPPIYLLHSSFRI